MPRLSLAGIASVVTTQVADLHGTASEKMVQHAAQSMQCSLLGGGRAGCCSADHQKSRRRRLPSANADESRKSEHDSRRVLTSSTSLVRRPPLFEILKKPPKPKLVWRVPVAGRRGEGGARGAEVGLVVAQGGQW